MIPDHYLETVYAGVLGKIIGVYLGRPFEGWHYTDIMEKLGEINYYVHERLNKPLIVTDDDISGTFTFIRAMPDHANSLEITPEQIGNTWLNYLVENRMILWWGGMGMSSEHTAYLRLKNGIKAPRSGSCEMNGKIISEQIGAQIFIDGWGMISPGKPEQAADLARKAASVSHDGEAIYGAQMIAAIEALAFIEKDIPTLIDQAAEFIPKNSVIHTMIQDIKTWHKTIPDWRGAREKLEDRYGYDKFGGNCHMVPNHGLIILSLLYGGGDFQKTLMIVNTGGWDTDCNSGNVGCIMGIRGGLDAINFGPDWRGPVADRLYNAAADGGRVISDAVRESVAIANIGYSLSGLSNIQFKHGARFHFELPGSVQGFTSENTPTAIRNVAGHSQAGKRSLEIHYAHLAHGVDSIIKTPTFIPPDALSMEGYALSASPTIYPGQRMLAVLEGSPQNQTSVECSLVVQYYNPDTSLVTLESPKTTLNPAGTTRLEWTVPDTENLPIVYAGVKFSSDQPVEGRAYLDFLTWDGDPTLDLRPLKTMGKMHEKAWTNGADFFNIAPSVKPQYRVTHNAGTGLVMIGTQEWRNQYLKLTGLVDMAKSFGIAARVQGLQRYYAMILTDQNKVQLIRQYDTRTILAEADYTYKPFHPYHIALHIDENRIQGWLDGSKLFDLTDPDNQLQSGASALLCEEGTLRVLDFKINC